MVLCLALAGGCATSLDPPAHRAASGDLAAASMGLGPRDAWFGSATSSDFASEPPRDWPSLWLARRIDDRFGEPGITPSLGRAPTWDPVGDPLWDRQVWDPARTPALGWSRAAQGLALRLPVPELRPARATVAPPMPSPPKPVIEPGRLWLPMPKPRLGTRS